MTANNRIQTYFFFSLFFSSIFLVFLIFWPFFNSIAIAFVIAVTLKPVYKKILKLLTGRRNITAGLMVFLAAVVIILPLFLLSLQVFNEIRSVVASETYDLNQIVNSFLTTGEEIVQFVIPNFTLGNSDFIYNFNLNSLLAQALDNWSVITTGTLKFFNVIFSVFISFVLLFFIFRDGTILKQKLIKYSPLNDEDDKKIILKLEQTINAVIRGNLIVALIKGLLAGIGFVLFGVANPALWGTITAAASLVPGIGSALVMMPIVIYVFLTGSLFNAFGILLWAIIVGLIDNILGPYFYSRGVSIHPILILISILGGLALFGPIGFLYGPLALSLMFALLEIYKQLDSTNNKID